MPRQGQWRQCQVPSATSCTRLMMSSGWDFKKPAPAGVGGRGGLAGTGLLSRVKGDNLLLADPRSGGCPELHTFPSAAFRGQQVLNRFAVILFMTSPSTFREAHFTKHLSPNTWKGPAPTRLGARLGASPPVGAARRNGTHAPKDPGH